MPFPQLHLTQLGCCSAFVEVLRLCIGSNEVAWSTTRGISALMHPNVGHSRTDGLGKSGYRLLFTQRQQLGQ